MSLPWMTVRGASANPSSLKFAALMNKQNIIENELFKPDRLDLPILSCYTDDLILVQDPFFFQKLKQSTIHYRGGYEPDGHRLRMWARFNHIAKIMDDKAFSVNLEDVGFPANQLRVVGNPKLCKGPDFDGIKGGSIVSRINSDPNVIDYYYLLNPASMNLGILGSLSMGHIGFSMFFRFMLEGDPVQDNGVDQTLWYHTESFDEYGIVVRIGPNGELKFFVTDNSVMRNFISPANKIVPNAWTTACLTYRFTGNVLTMTINNESQTDSASETPTLDTTEDNITIGISGYPFNSGRFVGRLSDIRWYTDLIFNRDHETNIWNNGRSICAVPAIFFDGTNDYVDCTNDATLWSQSLTKFSFSFWIYPTAGWDTNFRTVLQHGNSNVADAFGCFIDDNTTGEIVFYVTNAAATAITGRSTSLVLNKWNHIVCVYDNSLGSANVKIYLDGVVGATTGNLTEAQNLSNTLRLGDSSTDFAGYMREFKWWTTAALSSTDAYNLWQRKDSLVTAPNYWLKLNEESGNPTDWITRTKVGTLTNGAISAIWHSPRPIEYGSLSVAGHARFNATVDAGGYDSTGYDSTGYDTT